MDPWNLPQWLQGLAGISGGLALFAVAFLDSSFIPFPSVNDLLLIGLSVASPARMPYYALMATAGSLAGCLALFAIAKKGGEALFGQRAGPNARGVQRWMKRNGFLCLLIAALLPPPAPFKVFIFAAGALGMRLSAFVAALALARSLRFFGEGYLAIRYGEQAAAYLGEHRLAVALAAILLMLLLFLLGRWISRHPGPV